MQTSLLNIIVSVQAQIVWLFIFSIAFGILTKIAPCNPRQPLWRKSALTDIAYSLVIPVFTRFVSLTYVGIGVTLLFHGRSNQDIADSFLHGYGPAGALPVWA